MTKVPVPLRESRIAGAFRNRPFQKQGTMFAVRNRNVLIADEPGLGKSIQSIAAVVQDNPGGSVLVVAPKTAATVTWVTELRQWLSDVAPNDIVRVISGDISKTERIKQTKIAVAWERHWGAGDFVPGSRQWILLSPNYIRFNYQLDDNGRFVYDERGDKIVLPVREAISDLLDINWAAIIVDEAHQTLSGAHGDIKKQSAQSRGLRMLKTQPNALRIALSGTPFRGKHENLWGILNWLDPVRFRGYWNWVNDHFYQYKDPVFGHTVLTDIKSEKALYDSVSDLMIRRTKAEVAPDLEPKRYGGTRLIPEDDTSPIGVWIPMGKEQKRIYNEMLELAMARVEGGTLLANGVLAEITRLKQFANSSGRLNEDGRFVPALPSNKFEWLLSFLSGRGIDGKGPGVSKVLVASQFTQHLELFQLELANKGVESFLLTGKTPSSDRILMQEAFQSNSMSPFGKAGPAPDVFLFNTKAGGVSLTLDAADDVVLIDQTSVPDDQEQVEDRAHRISNVNHRVQIWNLASEETIDVTILKTTHAMRASLKQILDGSRGVDTVMKMLTGQE